MVRHLLHHVYLNDKNFTKPGSGENKCEINVKERQNEHVKPLQKKKKKSCMPLVL